MPKLPVVLIAVLVALPADPLTAQDTAAVGPLRAAVSATKPLARVRVELRGGQRVSGALVTSDATSLSLEDAAGARYGVPFTDVTRYWEQRRSVAAGAVTGGIAGAATGALVGMLMVGLCEYDCEGSIAGGAIVGGLAVGITGAVAGGVIGAAIPRWSLRWQGGFRAESGPPAAPVAAMPAAPADTAAPRRRVRETGELTLLGLAGYGGYQNSPSTGEDTRGAVAGGLAGLAFRVRRFTFGPDLAVLGGAEPVAAALWTFRVDLADRHRKGAVPYAIVGLGSVLWNGELADVSYFSGSFGIGASFARDHAWRAEARWHPVLQYADPSGLPYPVLFTAGVGRRFAW